MLITILGYSWNSHFHFEARKPMHISHICRLSFLFSVRINTCSLPPGTRCKQIFFPRVSVAAAERLSAKLSTNPLLEKYDKKLDSVNLWVTHG